MTSGKMSFFSDQPYKRRTPKITAIQHQHPLSQLTGRQIRLEASKAGEPGLGQQSDPQAAVAIAGSAKVAPMPRIRQSRELRQDQLFAERCANGFAKRH